ncbi:MAG: dockerin type I repeat-containing protein [Clostridia bacterium]|nr:dockerin type I repeat-containing protein [Clostridia bacterium]
MKKLIFAFVTLVLLLVCAVSASASEAPVKMEITARPEKLIYSVADAVFRTESVWNEQTETVSKVTYSYYPIDFGGLEITFTYADDSTKVFSFDENMSLAGSEFTVLNKTVQNAQNQWMTEKQYNVMLAFGELTAQYQVFVTTQLPDADKTISDISIAEYPAKRIYLDAEAFAATGFNENGESVEYKAYPFTAEGLILQVTYADGSVQFCSPAVLSALTGKEVLINDKQTVASEWTLGENQVNISFGELSARFSVYVDVQGHKFEDYFYIGNNMHEADCDYCGQSFRFDCEGGAATCAEQAVCTICESPYGETLPHEVYYVKDADGHAERCNNCDLDGAAEPHEFTAGEYDKENKHALYTCSVCAYSVYGQPKGDIDGDGKLTAGDARFILRASVGLETLTPQQTALADADDDGILDAGDARLVLRVSVGLETLNTFIPVTE